MIHLQTWLRWLMRLVLPFANWRVTVVLLRGQDRAADREVVLLSAGVRPGNSYIKKHLFAAEPAVVRTARVPVWRLQRLLDEWRPGADLTVVGIDRVSSRLFLSPHYLAVPLWVNSWMEVPEDLRAFARKHHSCEADIRRVRIKNFEFQCSREEKDFELFYDRFYQPFISGRHGELAVVAPRWRAWLLFKSGMIHWVVRGGERLAGCIVVTRGKDYYSLIMGVIDGRIDLMREGVLSSLYVHSIQHARSLGCTRIQMGGSEPSPLDGVFRYKSKWATGLAKHDGFVSANCVTLLSWNRLEGPVADFFSRCPVFHHDLGGFSALWAFPSSEPLTAENLQRHYNQLKTHGLHYFYILLPGGVPADFVCPPEVHLIPFAVVNPGGPERLAAYLHGGQRAR